MEQVIGIIIIAIAILFVAGISLRRGKDTFRGKCDGTGQCASCQNRDEQGHCQNKKA